MVGVFLFGPYFVNLVLSFYVTYIITYTSTLVKSFWRQFMKQAELTRLMAEAERAEEEDYQLAIMKYLSVIAHSLLIADEDD